MHARIAAGKQTGAVGHADGTRHIKIAKPHAPLRQTVYSRRFHHRMTATPQPVSMVLIGDEYQKIGLRHTTSPLTRCQLFPFTCHHSLPTNQIKALLNRISLYLSYGIELRQHLCYGNPRNKHVGPPMARGSVA